MYESKNLILKFKKLLSSQLFTTVQSYDLKPLYHNYILLCYTR